MIVLPSQIVKYRIHAALKATPYTILTDCGDHTRPLMKIPEYSIY